MTSSRGSAALRPRARAPRGEGSKLRELILDAAERLLAQTGDEDAVSIRAIARAVGVTPPSIYLHFADKESLILEVCERRFADFDAAVQRAGATTNDPIETHRRRARAYVRFGIENPEQYRILFMGKHTPPAEQSAGTAPGRAAFEHLVETVRESIDAGAFRRDLDPFIVAIGLWTAIHGLTSALISLPAFPWPDVDTLVTHLCNTQLRGLAASRKDQP
jgi:AcrR family transcriptional regulator